MNGGHGAVLVAMPNSFDARLTIGVVVAGGRPLPDRVPVVALYP